MCGIIGYSGSGDAVPVLVNGLKRMEYRGYDSAGIALLGKLPKSGLDFWVRRAEGRVTNLESKLKDHLLAHQGIAHTRWATHGAPTEINAHPHCAGSVSLVHNGIIENHAEIKDRLIAEGISFQSQTDTEVFAQLLNYEFSRLLKSNKGESPRQLVLKALQVSGAQALGHYSVLFMVKECPGSLFALHMGAPVVACKAEGVFVASDLQALLEYGRDLFFLKPGQILVAHPDSLEFFKASDLSLEDVSSERIEWAAEKVEKDGYEHFMLKEMFEQPLTVAETLSGRLPQDEDSPFLWDNPIAHQEIWSKSKRVTLVACGTAYHAAMIGKYYFEKMARVPVDVELASEFRYRDPVIDQGHLIGVISQSGETADTLAALRMARELGLDTFSICNVPGSTIARESQLSYPTKAGPEIGVASTKAFTNQLTILCALAADIGRLKGVDSARRKGVAQALARLPQDLERVLSFSDEFMEMGAGLSPLKTILFIGRGMMYPIALEGALKLKEITYRHAEGYAAGELKHGPIAMVDEKLAAVVFGPDDDVLAKTLSNLEEVRARNGKIIGIGSDDNSAFKKISDEYIGLKSLHWSVAPMAYVIPAQFISYGLAKHLGCDIDKPRNLAKSVTVE
ncbi:glutamine--fructose-6-phosphate transaminase (isomerizing) [bacterium]|nr:glutamine--fructose-6-phosphate transaminase (isomerizing) [bacterium]